MSFHEHFYCKFDHLSWQTFIQISNPYCIYIISFIIIILFPSQILELDNYIISIMDLRASVQFYFYVISKLKWQWNITTYLLEYSKSKTLSTPHADKDVTQQELLFIARGNAKWYRHFGRQLGNFLQNWMLLGI